jgi:hypothetical protein
MKHMLSYPCKKCHLPAIYLITFKHLVKSHPPTYKFSVECACKPGKAYDTEEEAIQAFNKANAPAKKKTYR